MKFPDPICKNCYHPKSKHLDSGLAPKCDCPVWTPRNGHFEPIQPKLDLIHPACDKQQKCMEHEETGINDDICRDGCVRAIGALTGVDNRPRFNEASKLRMQKWTAEERQRAIEYLQSLDELNGEPCRRVKGGTKSEWYLKGWYTNEQLSHFARTQPFSKVTKTEVLINVIKVR